MTYSELVIAVGTILTVSGIIGILWSIWRVMIAKSRNKENENNTVLNEAIKAVVPINVAALILSFLGLILVIFGIVLS